MINIQRPPGAFGLGRIQAGSGAQEPMWNIIDQYMQGKHLPATGGQVPPIPGGGTLNNPMQINYLGPPTPAPGVSPGQHLPGPHFQTPQAWLDAHPQASAWLAQWRASHPGGQGVPATWQEMIARLVALANQRRNGGDLGGNPTPNIRRKPARS